MTTTNTTQQNYQNYQPTQQEIEIEAVRESMMDIQVEMYMRGNKPNSDLDLVCYYLFADDKVPDYYNNFHSEIINDFPSNYLESQIEKNGSETTINEYIPYAEYKDFYCVIFIPKDKRTTTSTYQYLFDNCKHGRYLYRSTRVNFSTETATVETKNLSGLITSSKVFYFHDGKEMQAPLRAIYQRINQQLYPTSKIPNLSTTRNKNTNIKAFKRGMIGIQQIQQSYYPIQNSSLIQSVNHALIPQHYKDSFVTSHLYYRPNICPTLTPLGKISPPNYFKFGRNESVEVVKQTRNVDVINKPIFPCLVATMIKEDSSADIIEFSLNETYLFVENKEMFVLCTYKPINKRDCRPFVNQLKSEVVKIYPIAHVLISQSDINNLSDNYQSYIRTARGME